MTLPLRVPYRTPVVEGDSAFDAVAAIIATAWSDGTAVTVYDVLVRGEARGFTQRVVRDRVERWRAAGVIGERPAPRTRSPLIVSFNRTGVPLDRATLRPAAEAFLADEGVTAALRRDAATALRTVLAAPPYCSPAVLLARCETVVAADVHGLPARCAALLRADGQSDTSVRNRVSSLRALLRHGAAGRLLALVFPAAADLWAAAEARHYPLDDLDKAARRRASKLRCDLRAFPDLVAARRSELRSGGKWDASPDAARPTDPDAVSPEEAYEVILWLRRRGEFGRATGLSMALDDWARLGFGPYRAAIGGRPGLRSGEATSLALRLGIERSDTCDGLTRLLAAEGFPAEWGPFLSWVDRYHSIPQTELERLSGEFPTRRPRQQLRPTTTARRYWSVRIYLGIAVRRVGLAPAELTVARALGPCYRDVADALATYWAERAADGVVTSPFSKGLTDLLIGISLLSGAARLRLRVARFAGRGDLAGASAPPRPANPFSLVRTPADLADDPGEPDTPEEAALASARRLALNQVRWLDQRRAETSTHQGGATRLNLARLIGSLAPSAVERVQQDALDELERRARAGDDGRDFHDLCADVFLGGLVLSTAARAQELTHVRLDLQYPLAHRKERMLVLRGVDRKQHGRPHVTYLRETFLPRWAEELYLDRSRPALLARAPEGGRSGRDHPFLLVDTRGGAYGCVEEDRFGGGRRPFPWRGRVRGLVARWQRFVGPRLFALGHEVPTDFAEFTLHAMRRRLANAMYRAHGVEAATHLIGDTPEVVLRAYVHLNAAHTDFEDPYGTGAADPGRRGRGRQAGPPPARAIPPAIQALVESFARQMTATLSFEEQRALHSHAQGERVVELHEFWGGMDGLHARTGRPAPLRPTLALVTDRVPRDPSAPSAPARRPGSPR